MYDPFTMVDMYIKGKSTEEAKLVIQRWRDKIEELKRIIAHPDYEKMEKMCPTEHTRIRMINEYIFWAEAELEERGEKK